MSELDSVPMSSIIYLVCSNNVGVMFSWVDGFMLLYSGILSWPVHVDHGFDAFRDLEFSVLFCPVGSVMLHELIGLLEGGFFAFTEGEMSKSDRELLGLISGSLV